LLNGRPQPRAYRAAAARPPRLNPATLYYQDEVRAEDEFHTDNAPIPSRELDLARLLIEALAAGFEPTLYRDRYRENLS
jgi:DNA end-binding protein Ku